MRYWRVLSLAVALCALPAVAAANINVKIKQTTTQGTFTLRTLTLASPPGPTPTTLFLLSCPTPPCTETLGGFTFQDISAASRARVIKTDGASVDKVELKGLRVTLNVDGIRVLTIEYETQPGDLTAIPGNIYPYTAALLGTFTSSTGLFFAAMIPLKEG